jgi:hypothetical protein
VGDFTFKRLELLNKHVVERIQVFSQLPSCCSSTHSLKRKLLLLFEPLLLDYLLLLLLLICSFIQGLSHFNHVLNLLLLKIHSSVLLISGRVWLNHHFPHILSDVRLLSINGCQVLTVGHVQSCSVEEPRVGYKLVQINSLRLDVPESSLVLG